MQANVNFDIHRRHMFFFGEKQEGLPPTEQTNWNKKSYRSKNKKKEAKGQSSKKNRN